MQKIDFKDAVESVVSNDSRYAGDAYYFLQEVLSQAVNKQRKDTGGEDRHVSGEELLKVFRARAKKRFGPMAMSVLEEWGIRSCEDVGEIVFNLIDVGAFGKSDRDHRENREHDIGDGDRCCQGDRYAVGRKSNWGRSVPELRRETTIAAAGG